MVATKDDERVARATFQVRCHLHGDDKMIGGTTADFRCRTCPVMSNMTEYTRRGRLPLSTMLPLRF